MKRGWKRALAALLCAVMLPVSALAMPGLDAATSAWLDVDEDLRFALSMQLDTLVPYGEDTIALMNRLLRHLSMNASVTEHTTRLEVCVAGDAIIDLCEEDGVLTTGLLPNRRLTAEASVLDALSGADEEPAFDFLTAVEELQGCYQQLTDAIRPYAEEKTANYKISGVGTSQWSRIARLTPEQSAELAPLIAQVLGCGMDEGYREQLRQMTYGSGFIVGLYQTKQGGNDLAVYIKGNVTFADGSAHTLSYQWAFAEKDGGVRADTFKFEMNKSKAPRDDREISASYERTAQEDALKVKGESKCLVRNPDTGASVTTTVRHDLTGAEADGARTLSGSVSQSVRTAQGETAETVTATVSPALVLTASQGSGVLSGTADVQVQRGKNVETALTITFDEEPAELFSQAADTGMLFMVTDELPPSSLMQNMDTPDEPEDYLVGAPPAGYQSHTAPREETVVQLHALDHAERAALLDELYQNLAGKLLIALARLPQEDAALLADNMTEADYAAFLALVEGL